MHPVNGNKGIMKEQFFHGVGCIPYEISRKMEIGRALAVKRRSMELARFLAENLPVSEMSASRFLERLEVYDRPLSPGLFNLALPGLTMILQEHDISLGFRASARFAVNVPDEPPFELPQATSGLDVIGTIKKVVFRDLKDWRSRDGGKVNIETVNRVRANLLFFVGTVISVGNGKNEFVRGRDLKRIAHLIEEEHPGVIDNSIFCMRMALEKDARAWKEISEFLPIIERLTAHQDVSLSRDADLLLSLMRKVEGGYVEELHGDIEG